MKKKLLAKKISVSIQEVAWNIHTTQSFLRGIVWESSNFFEISTTISQNKSRKKITFHQNCDNYHHDALRVAAGVAAVRHEEDEYLVLLLVSNLGCFFLWRSRKQLLQESPGFLHLIALPLQVSPQQVEDRHEACGTAGPGQMSDHCWERLCFFYIWIMKAH